jgi:hypothetical protein
LGQPSDGSDEGCARGQHGFDPSWAGSSVEPTGSLHGRVTGPDGAPLASITVMARPESGKATRPRLTVTRAMLGKRVKVVITLTARGEREVATIAVGRVR